MNDWKADVAEHLEMALGNNVTRQDERIAMAAIKGLEEHALRRALLSWVAATGTLERYHTDVEYKMSVDVVARTMVAGVFGEMPLDREEQMKRNKALEKLMWDLR